MLRTAVVVPAGLCFAEPGASVPGPWDDSSILVGRLAFRLKNVVCVETLRQKMTGRPQTTRRLLPQQQGDWRNYGPQVLSNQHYRF